MKKEGDVVDNLRKCKKSTKKGKANCWKCRNFKKILTSTVKYDILSVRIGCTMPSLSKFSERGARGAKRLPIYSRARGDSQDLIFTRTPATMWDERK